MTKQAIIYVRVSTAGQAAEGISLEAQEAKARAYCESAGMDVAAVYADAGLSGKSMKHRPGLLAALDHVCKIKAAFVSYSLSRVARSTRDAMDIADRLDKAGADLVSLSEAIDTRSAAGKMVFRMLAVLAEFERDLTAERTALALAHKRASGFKTGGNVPFGFRAGSDGKLTPHAEEQEVIALVRSLHGSGYSLRQIGAELQRRGIGAAERKTWNVKTIARLVNRPIEVAA